MWANNLIRGAMSLISSPNYSVGLIVLISVMRYGL